MPVLTCQQGTIPLSSSDRDATPQTSNPAPCSTLSSCIPCPGVVLVPHVPAPYLCWSSHRVKGGAVGGAPCPEMKGWEGQPCPQALSSSSKPQESH